MNTIKTIGDYVAEDFRTAEIFRKNKIDFCCKGNRSVEEACEAKNINPATIYEEINKLPKTNNADIDFSSWPLDLLADYIEKTHHRYVEDKIPALLQFTKKIAVVHGDRHPELLEVAELFAGSAKELSAHLKKEELILFPFIRKMVELQRTGQPLSPAHFGTVENPVAMMKHEHQIEGERFARISEITNGYQFPEDACGTYRVTFQMLEDFEKDLHRHIHLENNILFPKSIELEKNLNQ